MRRPISDSKPIPASLVLMSDVDAPLRRHLAELVDVAGDGIDQAFGHCAGYPGPRARRRTRVAWLRRHQLPASAFYVNTIGRGLDQIGQETRLREAAFAVAGLRWVKDGAAAGYSSAQLWPVLVALAIVLATRVFADVNRISMHDFYRWRLASAYSVMRKGAEDARKGGKGAEAFPGVTPDPVALLSRLRRDPDQRPPASLTRPCW